MSDTMSPDFPDVDELTLDQKIGQLFQVGFQAGAAEDAIELIEKYEVGSLIYFSRNIDSGPELASLSERFQERALSTMGVPLLLSGDQEGGVVTRLREGGVVPSAMAVGATDDADLARQAGAAIGRQLRAAGINMNLAPVFDVAMNPKKGGIFRSFGSDPGHVGEMGSAVARGLQSEGVVATAKHFPGSGDVTADAHFSLPAVEHDRERLDRVELRPFQRAIDAGIDAIMVSHTAVPAVDSETRPSTTSRPIVSELIREDLGHDGLVMTDCMEMNAVADTVGTVEGAVEAIKAGIDIVLVSHTFERQTAAIEAVRDAVETGDISEERIDRSVRRVLDLKAKRVREPTTTEGTAEGVAETARAVANASVTLVSDPHNRLPITDQRLQVWAAPAERVSPAEDWFTYVDGFRERLETAGFEVTPRTLATADPEREDADGAWAIDDDNPDSEYPLLTPESQLDVASDESLLICTHDAIRDEVQSAVVREAETSGLEPVVLGVRNPYDALVLPDATTFLTCYDFTDAPLEAACDVLTGEREPRGTIPVSLDFEG